MAGTGVDVLRNSEQNAVGRNFGQPSFYSGTGRSANTGNKNQKNKFLGSKKTMGAMLIIMCLIGGGGIFLSSSQTLLGPGLIARLIQQTDVQFGDNSLRSLYLTKNIMKNKNSLKSLPGVGDTDIDALPSTLQNNLTSQDVEIISNGNESYFNFKGQTITADEVPDFYRNNIEFRDAYTNATYGRAAGFYDDSANKFYVDRIGSSRNLYDSYRQTGDAEADTKQYDDTMIDKLDSTGAETTTRTTNRGKEYALDEDGNRIPDGNGGYVMKDAEIGETSSAEVSSKHTAAEAEVQAGSFINKIAGSVQQVTNWGCTAITVGNMIAVSIAAAEMYNTINVFLGNSEPISKMMYGLGSESAYHPTMNRFTTSATTTIQDYSNPQISGSAANDSQGSLTVNINDIDVTGAATESEGFQTILADVPPNLSITENYSSERVVKTIGGAIGGALAATTVSDTIKNCANATQLTAFASIAVSLIPGVGQVHIFSQVLFNVGATILVTTAMSAFFHFLIPTVKNALYQNDYSNLVGKPLGEKTVSGGASVNGMLARAANGFSTGSEEALQAYNKIQSEAIAMENELDRYHRSPFDITSNNTFLGSIAFSLFPLLSVRNTSSVNTLLTATSNSIASLNNQVFASTNENNATYTSYYGSCPLKEGIGIKCDMYGNSLITGDPSTINIALDDREYQEALSGQFDCDTEGHCTIKEDSDLAKYINHCAGRTSPDGFTDYNILNSLSKGNIITTILGGIPLVGDVVDIFTAQETKDNLGWATNEICRNSPDNPMWNKSFKYFQRYIADMRKLEDWGIFQKTSLESSENSNITNSENKDDETKGNVTEEHTTVTIPGLQNNYKIAWVSDLHMIADGTSYVDQTRYDMFQTNDGIHSSEYLDTIINYLNNGDFDAVIFGGDMIDYYSTKNYETLRAGLSKLNIPWFYIYGSEDHDKYTGRTNESVANDLSNDSSAGAGDVIDLGELKIVGLNNSSNKNISSSDLNSVANTIQNAGKPVLLATHVPFASQIDNDSLKNSISSAHNGQAYYWTNGSSNWELSNNQAMQNFLNDNIYNDNTNVKGVFAGHVHTLSNDTKLTNNINQHIFKGAFSGSIGVITVTGENTAQNTIVNYDIPNRNPVTAYIEKYESEHPLDNSPAGYLARISGLTKNDAGLVLDTIAYYNFINNYDASTRLAMNGEASDIKSADVIVAEIQSQKELEHPIIGEGETNQEYTILISQNIVYADVRNRSYTV